MLANTCYNNNKNIMTTEESFNACLGKSLKLSMPMVEIVTVLI